MDKILIIDGSYLMYKSYFAFKNRHLKIELDGEEIITSAIFGFIRELVNIKTKLNHSFIICAWDGPPYLKANKYDYYKNKPRNKIPNLAQEKEIIQAFLFSLNIPCLISSGYEGEEVARSVIKKLKKKFKIDFYTNDEDCFVLISKNVNFLNSKEDNITKSRKFLSFNKKDLLLKYCVTPKQFRWFKALTGCSSDNIPGVKGIGKKYASSLINKYNNIEEILNNIEEIKKEQPKIAEKIILSKENKSLEESIYLTKIKAPKKLSLMIPEETDLTYKDILEFINAKTLLTKDNSLYYLAIKKSQTKKLKLMERRIGWKMIKN